MPAHYKPSVALTPPPPGRFSLLVGSLQKLRLVLFCDVWTQTRSKVSCGWDSLVSHFNTHVCFFNACGEDGWSRQFVSRTRSLSPATQERRKLNVAKLFFQELFIHCNLFFNIFLPFSFLSFSFFFFLINLFKSVGSVEMLTKAKTFYTILCAN